MTNHPRYSPPPQQHGYRPVSDQRGAAGHSGYGQQQTYPQGYDWRHGAASSRSTGSPTAAFAGQAGHPAIPPADRRRSCPRRESVLAQAH